MGRGKRTWYFSVIDVVEILSGSTIPRRYWSDLKNKLKTEGSEVYEKIVQLKIVAEDGKMRLTDAADTEVMFRVIQSIPSPKAEPFKLWLAREGGGIAGNARKQIEAKTGKKVITSQNAKILHTKKEPKKLS